MIEKEANFAHGSVLKALAAGGDAHNVFDVFPTETSTRDRALYSPLWDLQNFMYSSKAVASGENTAKTDSNVIRQLAAQGVVTSPGGTPLRSSGVIINCPALGFTDSAPAGPQTALSARVPVGGVQTGAGGTATDGADHTGELAALALAAGAALTAAGALSLRRNRSRS